VIGLVEATQLDPSVLVQIETVEVGDASYPVAIQLDPFHVIPVPWPPLNGLFVEGVQVTASELYTIHTLLSPLVPTATHRDPFQAIVFTFPAPPAEKGSIAVVQV
jgi:hypothetical protein